MMQVCVDTEFNGFGGELISMALVCGDLEFYEVLPLPENVDPWVAKNVIPVLGKAPISPQEFRTRLHLWLLQFDRPHFVADWYTDLVHLFSQFAGRSHAESLALSCTSELRDVDYVSEVPHNALSDARAIQRALWGDVMQAEIV